jgi:hypothetical protein
LRDSEVYLGVDERKKRERRKDGERERERERERDLPERTKIMIH